jgi:hypothetical protein
MAAAKLAFVPVPNLQAAKARHKVLYHRSSTCTRLTVSSGNYIWSQVSSFSKITDYKLDDRGSSSCRVLHNLQSSEYRGPFLMG